MNITLFGVPTSVSFWTFAMVAIFALDGYLYVKRMYKGEETGTYLRVGLLLAVLIVLSVAAHEFSHALVATKAFGIEIVSAGITWWGAYVEPGREMWPQAAFAISLAGPMCNLLLGALAALYVWAKGESLAENSVQYFANINLKLAVLNLLPVSGLDGSKALTSFNTIVFGGSEAWYWVLFVISIAILGFAFTMLDDWLKEL